MPTLTIRLPEPAARVAPSLGEPQAEELRSLVESTSVSRFDAEYIYETEGTTALFLLFARVIQDNLDTWFRRNWSQTLEAEAEAGVLAGLTVDVAVSSGRSHAPGGGSVSALLGVYVAAVTENLDAWVSSGDYPARPRSAAEVLTTLAAEGVSVDVPTVISALAEGGRA